MKDKEIIGRLLQVINIKDEEIITLLKRLPFEDLSTEEQGKVIIHNLL